MNSFITLFSLHCVWTTILWNRLSYSCIVVVLAFIQREREKNNLIYKLCTHSPFANIYSSQFNIQSNVFKWICVYRGEPNGSELSHVSGIWQHSINVDHSTSLYAWHLHRERHTERWKENERNALKFIPHSAGHDCHLPVAFTQFITFCLAAKICQQQQLTQCFSLTLFFMYILTNMSLHASFWKISRDNLIEDCSVKLKAFKKIPFWDQHHHHHHLKKHVHENISSLVGLLMSLSLWHNKNEMKSLFFSLIVECSAW